MVGSRRSVTLALALAALLTATHDAQAACDAAGAPKVPGAELQVQACSADMTSLAQAATDRTDATDWAGLFPVEQQNPSNVPGLQIDGYFPDTSTFNTTHGWFHDSQFVIRLPDKWNGKVVMTGAPGVRKQYAPDPIIGDFAIARGYAYASTDKGNGGQVFYTDGTEPGDAGVEWNFRVTQLAEAVREVVPKYYGRPIQKMYMSGISQGGYLTRWQIEHNPQLFDGGIDWEGTLWTTKTPNVFTVLAAALKNYPTYLTTGSTAAHDAVIKAGFAEGSEFLWPDHYAEYWDLTMRTYREEFDPDYDGAIPAGIPFCQSGIPMCDADYDWDARPDTVKQAMRKIELTGDLKRPLISLHGTLDSLLPIATSGDPYTRMVDASGKHDLHRYYVVENANHVDGRYDIYKSRLRPLQPCWREALTALEGWVENGTQPPPDQFVADTKSADVPNVCKLAQGPVAAPGPLTTTGATAIKRVRPKLTAAVRRVGPRRYRTTGRVVLPKGTGAAQACGAGTVVVTFRTARRHTISSRTTKLDRSCRFASAVTFHRRRIGTGRLTVTVRFYGNRTLLSASVSRRPARA